MRMILDTILVKPLEHEERTAGGLFIADVAKKRPSRGRVILVGPGRRDERGKNIPMDIGGGDIVYFNEFAGSEITLNGETLLVITEADVLAADAEHAQVS